MKKQIMTLGLMALTWSSLASAAQMELASQTPKSVTYKITDGYGEYAGVGATKIQASAQAREACVMQKVMAYESRHGETPDADTTDLFIDACINK